MILLFQFGAFFSAVMTKKIELNTWSDSSKKKPQIMKDNFWPVYKVLFLSVVKILQETKHIRKFDTLYVVDLHCFELLAKCLYLVCFEEKVKLL